MEKKKSPWKLVEINSVPPAPGVVEARQRWEKQQVMCLTPWGQWRRGVVLFVGNDGVIKVGIYQNKQVPFAVGVRVEKASVMLRMASH